MDKIVGDFVWDVGKELVNIQKHGIDFTYASQVFKDPKRKVYLDALHSLREDRFICVGKVGDEILTVRLVCRERQIRIFGAGNWRKGKEYYEKDL